MGLLRNKLGNTLFEQLRPVLEAGDYDQLVEQSVQLAKKVSADVDHRYGLAQYNRWDFSQDTGELTLSDDGRPRIAAKVQVIGTYSFSSRTWLWAWANQSFDESLLEDSRKVRALGLSREFQELTSETFSAEEDDCWGLAAVSLAVCGGQGLYGGLTETGRVFFLLKQIQPVTEGPTTT